MVACVNAEMPAENRHRKHGAGVRLIRGLATVGVLALFLSGCTAGSGKQSAEVPISSLRLPTTSSKIQSYYTQSIHWSSCGKGYRCTSISAPLDWSKPSGKSIHLALLEHRATGKRLGSLLVNPGGPGGSGVEMVAEGVDNAVDSTLAEHYDIVGFDPRGVGYSSAVKCGGAEELDKYLYDTVNGTVGSKAWIAGQKAKSTSFAKACKKSTGPLLGQIDTISAARDMDMMRAALGDKKLNYLGYSYGTYLGTVYAGLFPDKVGRMVFDGPDDPWYQGKSGNESGNVSQAVGFEDDLTAYLKSCLKGQAKALGEAGCPFTGGVADATADIQHSLAAAATHPIKYTDGRSLNASTLALGITFAMYDTSYWPYLTTAFNDLKKGDAKGAFFLADAYNNRSSKGKYYDNTAEANQAIGCLEGGSSYDLKADAKELTQLRKKAPILGPYFAYSDLICAGWPYGPTAFPEPIKSTGASKIVLVGTTGDPATPYPGAKALAHQLGGSVLVTYHGEGHTAYNAGHACVNTAVDDYLVDGKLPARGLSCR
jgi:pimeloyl-ACP methyl ester carboxylesterase